jgi:hypothetical protein
MVHFHRGFPVIVWAIGRPTEFGIPAVAGRLPCRVGRGHYDDLRGLVRRSANPACEGGPTPVSDTAAMSRSWDELVEQAQRDVHRMEASVGGPYFEKEAADVLAALRLWMDLSGRGDGDWLREHLARDPDRLLADARRDLAVSGEEYAAQLLESVQQMREQDRDRVKDVVRIGLSWST